MINDKAFPFIKQVDVSFQSDSWKKLFVTEPSLGFYCIHLLKGCLFCFLQADITGPVQKKASSGAVASAVSFTQKPSFPPVDRGSPAWGRQGTRQPPVITSIPSCKECSPHVCVQNKLWPSLWPPLAENSLPSPNKSSRGSEEP